MSNIAIKSSPNKSVSGADSPTSLGEQPIGRLLVKYSVPAIIASVATSLYNIIDSIFIGRGVGAMAIAGLAITFPLMNLVAAFCMLIAVGGATISSIFLGQKNLRSATDVANNVLILCLINALIFGGLTLIFLDPILYFFGATDETIPYAHEFMQIILYGTPISYVFIGLNYLMRATGYPKKAMISALISVVVNVIFAPLFIFEFDWGINGAAAATVCGQSVAFFWVLIHFLNKNSYVHFVKGNSWLQGHIVKRIYAIGMSPFLMNVCACVVVIFINKSLLSVGGDDGNLAVGAYGILNRTAMFFVMIVFGVTQGMQPILGYNFGAGNVERVKRTLYKGLIIGGTITSVGCLVTQLFPSQVAELFTVEPALIEMSRRAIRIFFLAFPVVGCQIIIQNFFQSIGKPKVSIFLSLTRQLIFLLPFLWILPPMMGIEGVWASMCSSDFLAFVVAVITAIIIFKRSFKKAA
ncbi:MAG: MATE family efflux transporter [Muribaculaceae bacterium]|nr:MATE family efflux transporter [Muribaculaceae bacterium]